MVGIIIGFLVVSLSVFIYKVQFVRYFVTTVVIYDLNCGKVKIMNFVKIFHFTNNLVLGTNFRIWLLILSYICTTSYDGCTICVH